MKLSSASARYAVLLSLAWTTFAFDAAKAEDSADQPAPPEWYSLHGQITNITQYHPRFTSPFRGTNSLDPGNRGDETFTVTLFAGIRVWDGLEFYANPEVDQGFGIGDTLGIAAFTNGQGSKVGSATPYVRLQRAFGRYTIGLGGATETDDPAANQLGGSHLADRIVITFGKFNSTDIFDTNSYAHDPTADFLNWAVIDAGAFDFAADAWGYSYGAAVEWWQSWWTLRAGLFDLSRVPNGKYLERGFGQFSTIAEFEARHDLLGAPGKVKLLAYQNTGRMADYNDAIREGIETGTVPDVSKVRRYNTRPGAEFNAEQQILPDLGAFLRASLNDGHLESYEFTEIDRSLSGGFALKGTSWDRPNDTVGLAGVISDISNDARAYFAAGGLGILIGDGQLPKYGSEKVLELYYNAQIIEGITFSADYQHIEDPAYDAVRGPVDVLGFRVHGEF